MRQLISSRRSFVAVVIAAGSLLVTACSTIDTKHAEQDKQAAYVADVALHPGSYSVQEIAQARRTFDKLVADSVKLTVTKSDMDHALASGYAKRAGDKLDSLRNADLTHVASDRLAAEYAADVARSNLPAKERLTPVDLNRVIAARFAGMANAYAANIGERYVKQAIAIAANARARNAERQLAQHKRNDVRLAAARVNRSGPTRVATASAGRTKHATR